LDQSLFLCAQLPTSPSGGKGLGRGKGQSGDGRAAEGTRRDGGAYEAYLSDHGMAICPCSSWFAFANFQQLTFQNSALILVSTPREVWQKDTNMGISIDKAVRLCTTLE
jgi:hypothetical protein